MRSNKEHALENIYLKYCLKIMSYVYLPKIYVTHAKYQESFET